MKQILFIILTLLITGSVFSQNSKFSIGIDLGPNYSYFKRNSFDKNSNHPIFRFSSGLSFNYNISKYFSVETCLSYEQKGDITDYYHTDLATAFPPFNYDEWRYSSRFSYLTNPIFLKVTFGKKFKYFVNAGGYISYLLSKKTIRQSKYFPEQKYDYPDYPNAYIKNYDYGIIAGIGVSRSIKERIAISVELRNNIGICDIMDQEKGWDYKEILKTNSFNLLFGLKYFFKCKQATK